MEHLTHLWQHVFMRWYFLYFYRFTVYVSLTICFHRTMNKLLSPFFAGMSWFIMWLSLRRTVINLYMTTAQRVPWCPAWTHAMPQTDSLLHKWVTIFCHIQGWGCRSFDTQATGTKTFHTQDISAPVFFGTETICDSNHSDFSNMFL